MSGTKRIDVKEQPPLGTARTFSLTIIGIRYRLFRSLVTVVVVIVAIAFLMNVLSESLIKMAIMGATRDRIAGLRHAAVWAARLSSPGTVEEIVRGVAAAAPDSPLYRETLAFGKMSSAQMMRYRETCRVATEYLEWFADLRYGQRRRLVHHASGCGIFERLQEAAAFDHLLAELKTMRSLRFLTDMQSFREFLRGWAAVKAQTEIIRRGRAAGVAEVTKCLSGRPVMAALQDIEGQFGEVVRKAGFQLSDAKLLARQAREITESRDLEGSILRPRLRRAVAGYKDMLTPRVNVQVLWALLGDEETAEWYLEQLTINTVDPVLLTLDRVGEDVRQRGEDLACASAGAAACGAAGIAAAVGEEAAWHCRRGILGEESAAGPYLEHVKRHSRRPPSYTVGRLMHLAALQRENTSLTRVAHLGGDVGGGLLGIGERMTWLVVVSMLVCVVGIANAMLMSVTERFQEIATLKCLGALDTSIMLMCVMEASLLGVIGGVAGAAVGAVIGFLRMRLAFGGVTSTCVPFGSLFTAMGISVITGIILAAFAALYPSFKAARLAPMEAMRVE